MKTLLKEMIALADERGMEAPEGLNWGFRTVRSDLTSKHGFRWGMPGTWVEAPGPIDGENHSGCPMREGDGICVARTWSGMASGGIPALTILLVGWKNDDVLGAESGAEKLRVKKAFVRDIIDGCVIVVSNGYGANLTGASLDGARNTTNAIGIST